MTTFSAPGLSDGEAGVIGALLTQIEGKTARNLLRASYYDGKRAIRQVGSVIPPQYYRLGIVLGWSAKAVDTLARRCNIDGFDLPGVDLDGYGLGEFSRDNDLTAELSGALTSSLIHASAFLINTQGGEGEAPSLLHVKDALNGSGTWNERTRRLDDFLSVTSRDADGPTGLTLYLPDLRIDLAKDRNLWAVTSRVEHSWGVPVEVLAYKPRPARRFGSSRISRPVMSLHDQALRTIIRMEGHADVYSYPELWMLGADPSIFKNADGSAKASWQVMLGRIKGIPDDESAENPRADVKQFAASSPMPHIEQLKQQAQLFSGETSVPLTSLGVSDASNPTSADSYIASREDLIAEAEGATDDWSAPIGRAVARGLAMAHGERSVPAQWLGVAPRWRSPIYLSRAAQADAGMKQLSAIPWLADSEIGLELVGLSAPQIQRALADQRRLSGSAALRAITDAAGGGVPAVALTEDPAAIKAKADAMGVLIRSGVAPEVAAATVGLSGMAFTGAVPTSLRLPTADAAALESGGP